MILRSLEVEGFRCFDRPIQILDFASGLNVLSGPNGAGKSTLLRALRHVLVDSHSLTGAVVKQAMAPWGRALNPRIRVAMSQGGEEWRLEKRFLTSTSARLERLENGVFRPVAEGKEAEAKVRSMLQAEAPAKGMATESHVGLLQVLWTPQGAPILPDWCSGVRLTLQEAFGAALSSRAADELTQRIGARFEEYFTPTGQVKKSSPVTPLQNEVAQLREQLQLLQLQWQTAGRNREAIAVLRERIEQQSGRLALLLPELKRAGERKQAVAEATSAELRARQAFDALDGRVRNWREDIAAQQQLDQQVREATALHAQLLSEREAAEKIQPEIQQLEQELESLQQRGVDARAWLDYLRAVDLDAERASLRSQLAAIAAPVSISEIRRLHQQLEVKQAALAAASLRLTVEAEAPLTMEVDGVVRSLASGETVALTSPQSIAVRLPGTARITAASANAQATGLAAQVDTIRTSLAGLLQGETLAVLEQRFEQRDLLQRELEKCDAEAHPLDARRAEFNALVERNPEWKSSPPELNSIREAWKLCKERIDQKRSQYNLTAIATREASARTTLDERQRQLAQILARLAQHAATGPLEALEEQQREAQISLAAAKAHMELLRSEAPADFSSLQQSVSALEAAIAFDKEAAARLEGEVASQQSYNLYSRLAETEERLSECTALLARQSRRASAILLLKNTLQTAQSNLTASLPEQIAEHATRNWRHIAGPTAHAIRINQSWAPAGLHVPDATAAIEELSGGEAEQVAFATRLALATQLARDHRQLAVFDDAFLATDPFRAGRILDLLAGAVEKLQIIVLTCHPARYETLPGVRHFDLEKLKQ